MKALRAVGTRTWLLLVLAAWMMRGATAGAQAPGLEALWPHRAGNTWTHDRVVIDWAPGKSSQAATVRFTFGDPQPLGGTVVVQPLTVDVSGTTNAMPALYRQLAMARPQLAARVAAAARNRAGTGAGTSELVIYDAGLVRVAADEIAAYVDPPLHRSWLYLEADLTPGHTFRLQLLPDVADSLFLNGTVLGAADVSTPAGSFAGALCVRYDVDYGWNDLTDSLGQIIGQARSLTRGEIFYAPGIGPVLARETFIPRLQVTGNLPPAVFDSTFAELRLTSCAVAPTRLQPATWTQLKQCYR
jgi:hypothetical protein